MGGVSSTTNGRYEDLPYRYERFHTRCGGSQVQEKAAVRWLSQPLQLIPHLHIWRIESPGDALVRRMLSKHGLHWVLCAWIAQEDGTRSCGLDENFAWHSRDIRENFSLEDVMAATITVSPQHLTCYISLVPIRSVSIVCDGDRQHTYSP